MIIGDTPNTGILDTLQTQGIESSPTIGHTHAINNSYSQCSQYLSEYNTLEVFEEQFNKKYKVKFEDFVEIIMKDYPELKI